MAQWRGYVLVRRAPALTDDEWLAVLLRLRSALNYLADARQPSQRLHYRRRLDGDAVIIEATFDSRDLDIENLSRLPAYLAAVLPRFTVEQVRNAMRNYIHIQGGTTESAYAESRDAARAYLVAHVDDWESGDG